MSDLIAINFDIRIDCAECDESFPLGGYAETYPCPECGTVFEPDYQWLRNTYGDDQLLRGEELSMSTVGEHRIRGVGDPTCASCKATFAVTEIADQLDSGTCACPRCKAAIAVREAPGVLGATGYEYLLGEDVPASGAGDHAAKPVVLKCPECDAALRVDGSSRTVPCVHCQADVYLPDGVWRKLHPKRRNHAFSALFDPTTLDQDIADAASAATTPEDLEELAEHLVFEVRDALSENLAAPPFALTLMAADPHGGIRAQVARHANTPPEILAAMAEDGVSEAADNPRTPAATLATLAGSDDVSVRAGLARNPATAPAVLLRLAADAEPVVRLSVACNPATPPEVLVRLADDEDYQHVGARLAFNPSTPAEALRRLAAREDERCAYDDDRAFRERGDGAPAFHDRIVRAGMGVSIHAILAVHPNLPAEALPAIADNAEEGVRAVVAADPRTPPEILKRLCKDRESVAAAARANPSCPSWWRRLF